MRTPARCSITSARRDSVQFGRSATGPDRTSSATANARSALTGAGPGAADFFSASMPPVMKVLRQNRTVSSRTPNASAIWLLVQPESVSKIARARSASPRSRERLSASRARLCSSVAATGDLPAMIPISCQINRRRLLSGFRVVTGTSGDEARDEGAEESFAPAACVVYELEEAEVVRQLLLRDAPMRAEPGAQQGPEPLDGVDVHLAKAIPVLVAGVFALSVADGLVLIAPALQASVDTVLVGMDEGTLGNRGHDDRLDRDLLHVGQHAQHHLATTLDQAEDGWLVLLQRASTRRPS